ncbi:hypothetical protein [Snodgrassella sp.]|uniref:hypothetical protein n=1 Tax=Snodgrassella sp. TaxID=2815304 RepID=UPI0025855FD3|nr:hypothetical protein [Snodgrassella sp.]MCO6527050.1 hypothetical protein [Snodgrassella sp.]
MNYLNGNEIRAGDKLSLEGGMTGIVLCSFDSKDYLPEFNYESWIDICKTGIMVDTDVAGLIHYSEPKLEFKLLKRKNFY